MQPLMWKFLQKCTLAAICQKEILNIPYEGTDCNFKGKLKNQEEEKKKHKIEKFLEANVNSYIYIGKK